MLISGDKQLEMACETYYDGGDVSSIRKILDAHLSNQRPRLNSLEDDVSRRLRSVSIDMMTAARDRGNSLAIDPFILSHCQSRKDSLGSIGSFGSLNTPFNNGRGRGSSNLSVKSRSQSDQYFEDFCAGIAENLSGDYTEDMGTRVASKTSRNASLSTEDIFFPNDSRTNELRGQSNGLLFDFEDGQDWTNADELDLHYAYDQPEKDSAPQKSNKSKQERIGGLTKEERRAKIDRWLEKRKKRNWSKNKTHYKPRQAFAKQRIRIKGRFVKITHPLHPDNPANKVKKKTG
jgi:hypothetical protein